MATYEQVSIGRGRYRQDVATTLFLGCGQGCVQQGSPSTSLVTCYPSCRHLLESPLFSSGLSVKRLDVTVARQPAWFFWVSGCHHQLSSSYLVILSRYHPSFHPCGRGEGGVQDKSLHGCVFLILEQS